MTSRDAPSSRPMGGRGLIAWGRGKPLWIAVPYPDWDLLSMAAETDNDTVPHASLLIPATAYELRVTPTVVRHGVTAIRAEVVTAQDQTVVGTLHGQLVDRGRLADARQSFYDACAQATASIAADNEFSNLLATVAMGICHEDGSLQQSEVDGLSERERANASRGGFVHLGMLDLQHKHRSNDVGVRVVKTLLEWMAGRWTIAVLTSGLKKDASEAGGESEAKRQLAFAKVARQRSRLGFQPTRRGVIDAWWYLIPERLRLLEKDDVRLLGNANSTSVGVRFEQLSYFPAGRSGKQVLRDVCAHAPAAQLTALMGPSGSGKTSLLTVGAGMTPASAAITGCVAFVRGDTGSSRKQQRRLNALPREEMGFVFQDDVMFGNLSVRETLMFVSQLKILRAQGWSDDLKQHASKKVDTTLEQLGLTHVADSRVGDARLRGVSGGERKRLAVGMELCGLYPPPLLLMDEPTTGLDSASALSLMQVLRRLTSDGHTVIASIHQPRTTSFELTHHLILMHGGEVCFDGESSDVVSQLEFALAKTIPPRTNTADWLMDVLTNDEDGVNAAAAWRRTKAKDSMDNLAEVAGPIDDDDVVVEAMEAKRASSPKSAVNATVTAVVEMGLLFRRALIQQRGTSLTFANLVSTAFATLWSACFWFNLDGRTTAKLFERRSLLFFMLISQANAIVIASVNAFASERVILTRDKAKGLYRTSTYFIAKTLSDGMNILIMPLFYAVIVYFACNLRRDGDGYYFFSFIATFVLSIQVAQSVGLLFSAIFPNVQMSLILAPQITLSILILGGFYLSYDNLPTFVRWLSWLSFARYSFTAMVLNEFGNRQFSHCLPKCDSVSTVDLDVDRVGISSALCRMPGEQECTIAYGDDVVRSMYMHEESWPIGKPTVGACLAILVVYQLVCRGMAFIALIRNY